MELALAHLRRAHALASSASGTALQVPPSIAAARVDFGAFCTLMNKPPAEHHLLWHREFITGKDSSQLLHCAGPNTAVLAPRGPLAYGTRVAVPGGWAAIEELRTGDLVYADDGQLTEVLGVQDYGEQECFRVEFSDGTSMICDDSHRFDVRRIGTDEKGGFRTTTLQEIRCFVTAGMEGNWRTGVRRITRMAAEGEKPWLDSRGYARYQVPVADPVEREPVELPLDPYLLGVLIGDGALTTGSVRFHKSCRDIEDRVRSVLPEECALRPCGVQRGSWSISHRLGCRCPGPRDGTLANPVAQALAGLGLWQKKSHEKFIPREYLAGSIAQRIALLQGLLDTDGTCKKQSGLGGVSFGTSSAQLLDDICELVRSLGGLAFKGKPYASYYYKDGVKVPCRTAYRVSFRFPAGVMPFHSSAKACLYSGPSNGRSNGGRVRSIQDIVPVGRRLVRCITVAHGNERFLIDDYVVSKNSAKSTSLGMLCGWLIGTHAAARMMLRMLYLSYSLDIARSRSHTIKTLIQSQKYREVFPMVQLSKLRQSDELWSIDYDYAGIQPDGDDPYTMVAQGLAGSIVSRRSQLIVLDDVIKSSESIQNPDVRRKLITNWQEVVQPTMLQGGRAIALGTRFMSTDIFGTTFNVGHGWRVVTQQAIVTDEDGIESSYWPSMYTLDYLRKLRSEDPVNFSYQFQNRPVSKSDVDFPDDWLRLGDLTEQYDAVAVGVDLSSGLRERNDFTVMVLAGLIDDRVEFIDYRRFRVMGNLEKLDRLCELLADWGLLLEDESKDKSWFPTDVTVTAMLEAISYQQSLQADAKTILHDRRNLRNIVLKPVPGYRGDKLSRLRGTFGLFQTGRVVWNRWINWEPFWSELLNYGSTDHDDCPDAMVLAIKGLLGPGRLQPSWGEWGEESAVLDSVAA